MGFVVQRGKDLDEGFLVGRHCKMVGVCGWGCLDHDKLTNSVEC
jgi:hypothetical protein